MEENAFGNEYPRLKLNVYPGCLYETSYKHFFRFSKKCARRTSFISYDFCNSLERILLEKMYILEIEF